jgi:hypothetical protein
MSFDPLTRRYETGRREDTIWQLFADKVSGREPSSLQDFREIFQELQAVSGYWTKKHIKAWIYNHSFHTKPYWQVEILAQIPQKVPPVRFHFPPPPAWSVTQPSQSNPSGPFASTSLPESVSVEEEMKTNDQTASILVNIMQSVIEMLRAPSLCLHFPIQDQELVKLVSEFLYQSVADNIALLAEQLHSEHKDVIVNMLDLSKRRENRLRHLERMREAKVEKQNDRTERYKRAVENLAAWRTELAHQCVEEILEEAQEPVDPSELAVSDDSVRESIYGPTPGDDFRFDLGPVRNPSYERNPEAREKYLQEVLELSQLPRTFEKLRRYADFPLSLRFAYLLSTVSDRALNIARFFLPLPGPSTVYRYFHQDVAEMGRQLTNEESITAQIDQFGRLNELNPETPVSVSIDAMATNSDGFTLPAADSQYAFVIYGQPLDRRKRCMPIHVINAPSGQATEKVQERLDMVCSNMAERGIRVKYVCSDGDPGYNTRHAHFFDTWFPEYAVGGLKAALERISKECNIPVSDFLHLWKQFLARMKNHPVTLSPDSLDHLVTGKGLEEFLHLGPALEDKSAIGKMRDAYALQCFSLKNCLKCLEQDHMTEFLYLLPFTLQQVVVRNPRLTRYNRLAMAVLSFQLLVHYMELSFGDHLSSVTQRYNSRRTEALTFTENSVWPRDVNLSVLRIVCLSVLFARLCNVCLWC